jgi:polar amino acid transport system ATP-binding protein
MLEISKLSKCFGVRSVLRNVDLQLASGEIVGLIGASGSGKSLTARCIVGFQGADTGFLTCPGFEGPIDLGISRAIDWPRVRRVIGYVSQEKVLRPYVKIINQISEGPEIVLGIRKNESRDMALHALEELNVVNHAQKYPTEVSGGELARICLARAFVMAPKVVVCDEPFANLDPLAARMLGIALLRIAQSGTGVLLISHQLNFLRHHSAKLNFLCNGCIQVAGTPTEFYSNSASPELRAFIDAQKEAG